VTRAKRASASETFWKIRSAKYDKLYWTKDTAYIDEIIRVAALQKNHIALDVGSGTGVIARQIKRHVKHVLAVDISGSMLEKGKWSDISTIKWDIGESLFADGTFHRVFARMVFHHILDNLDRAILRCYDLLKDGGRIIVAEGVPPVNDPDVTRWYSEMFKLKEERRTFIPAQLCGYLAKNGFRNVKSYVYHMEAFSILNWIRNSGLSARNQKKILDMHKNAPQKIKTAYNMRLNGEDCIVKTKNVIVVGKK
jgi:ubiquinone/menaquinone biosynthesis C-methylase UbiE